MRSTQTAYQRILKVERFYGARGCNKESVNKIKRKIISLKFNKIDLLTN